MTKPTLVCATKLHSCGLACIESILADIGISKSQDEMIHDWNADFPAWASEPGLLNSAEVPAVFNKLGLSVFEQRPRDSMEAVQQMAAPETIGAILFTTKFWINADTRTQLVDYRHGLRVTAASSKGVTVMNPYRCPAPARLEDYSWSDVSSFAGLLLVYRKAP